MEAETGVARGNARAFVTGSAGAASAELIGAHVRAGGGRARAGRREASPGRADGHRARRPGREDHLLRGGGRGADAQDGVDERQVRRRHRRRHRQDRGQAEGGPRGPRAAVAARPEDLPDRRQVRRVRRDRHQRPAEAGRPGRGADGLALRRDRAAEPLGALARQHAAAARAAGRRAARVHPGASRDVAGPHPSGVGGTRHRRCQRAGRSTRRMCVPPQAEFYPALGAIEFGRQEADGAAYLGVGPPRGDARRAGDRARPGRARRPSARHGHGPRRVPGALRAAGLDAAALCAGGRGSAASSASTPARRPPRRCLLDEDGRVLAKAYQLSRGNPIEDAIEMFRALRTQVESQRRPRRTWRASSPPATRRTS